MILACHLSELWRAFKEFFHFTPVRISLSLLMISLHGLTAGVGLLMIIPLLNLVGFDMASGSSQTIAHTVERMLLTRDL